MRVFALVCMWARRRGWGCQEGGGRRRKKRHAMMYNIDASMPVRLTDKWDGGTESERKRENMWCTRE